MENDAGSLRSYRRLRATYLVDRQRGLDPLSKYGMLASASVSAGGSHSGSHTVDAVIDLIAGSIGGASCVFVGQPLDTVKVKMQTFPTLYNNGLKCFTQTFMKEGIQGLYAGTVPSLAANIAENSVLFAAYGMCQKIVQYTLRKPNVSDLNAFHNACAGFLAAFFSSLTLCPTELVKCRLQAMRETFSMRGETRPNIGPWTLTRTILQTEGIAGMFRGLTPTFAREMPGYFFFFGGYEVSKVLLTPPGRTKDEIGLVRTVICGGIGGMCLWSAIFPFDVIKSRIQVAGSSDAMVPLMIKIIKHEGVKVLYKGYGPTMLRTIPACGALFVAFEFSKKYMHRFVDNIFD